MQQVIHYFMNVFSSCLNKNRIYYILLFIFGCSISGYVVNQHVSQQVGHDVSLFNTLAYTVIFVFYFYIYWYIESKLLKDTRLKESDNYNSYPIFVAIVSCLIFLNYYFGDRLFSSALGLALIIIRLFLLVFLDDVKFILLFRNKSSQLLISFLILSAIFLCSYIFLAHDGRFDDFVWIKADSRHYHWLSNALIRLEPLKSYFQLGLPILMLPFNLLMGAWYDGSFELLQLMNPAFIVIFGFMMIPVTYFLTMKSVPYLDENVSAIFYYILIPLIIIISAYLYVACLPEYISYKDTLFHPVMLLGLVPAVEPLNALFIAFSCYVLSNHNRSSYLEIGALVGFSVMVKESNAIFAFLLLGFLFLQKGARIKAVLAGVVSLFVYGPQFLYNKYVYDTWVAAGRVRQWDRIGERWNDRVEKLYGLQYADAPPLMSIHYAKTNLPLILEQYGAVIIICLVAYAGLMRFAKSHWSLWSYCITSVLVAVFVHATFIRLGATYRYIYLVMPCVMVLLISSLSLINKNTVKKSID